MIRNDNKKLLIVGNISSIHTNNLLALVGGYFSKSEILDSRPFSLHRPISLIKEIFRARKLIKHFRPSIIILYQIDIAAFFVTLIKGKIPTLVVGIGSDVLVMPKKSKMNYFLAKFVINKGSYFNAGSKEIAQRMTTISSKNIDILLANLGTDDILPKTKENIIFSNRLHKNLYHIDNIIDAFALFLRDGKHNDWLLVIAANGNEEEYKEQIHRLGIEKNVRLVGWLNKEQNAHYYSISKIWVSMAESDSISISLLEAMSSKCIPICYDVPALNGFLTNDKDAVIVKDMTENYFLRALSLDNDEILSANRQKARNFADKETNRQRFYSLFDTAFKANN